MNKTHKLRPACAGTHVCLAMAALAFFCCGAVQAETRAALPPPVKRVLFLGDSITYAGQYTAFVEAYFVTRDPGRRIEFINVGLPSETVSGLSETGHAGGKFPRPVLSERLARVLTQTKPDLVFACYGMNDGIYQPFDEQRFQAFAEGIRQLRAAVADAHAKIIHLTPPHYDGQKTGNLAYISTLDRYSQWLLDQRRQGWDVIDIHGPMTGYIAQKRKEDRDFVFAKDGVHPNDFGHWLMAKQVLLHLGARDLSDATDARQMVAAFPNGSQVLTLVEQREALMRDAWLTAIGHKRPEMKTGLPLPQAREQAEKIQKQIEALTRK